MVMYILRGLLYMQLLKPSLLRERVGLAGRSRGFFNIKLEFMEVPLSKYCKKN